MNALRRDLQSALTVLAVTIMVASVFPYVSLRFRALPRASRPASSAFVTLTEAEEAEALRVAKTSWQVDPSGFRRLRVALAVDDLPDYPYGPVAPVPNADARNVAEVFHFEPGAFPAPCGASAPQPIEAEAPVAPALPFPKDELLKID